MGFFSDLYERFSNKPKEHFDYQYQNGIKIKHQEKSTKIKIPRKIFGGKVDVIEFDSDNRQREVRVIFRSHDSGYGYDNHYLAVIGKSAQPLIKETSSDSYTIEIPSRAKYICQANIVRGVMEDDCLRYSSDYQGIDKKKFHHMLSNIGTRQFIEGLPKRKNVVIPKELGNEVFFGHDERGIEYMGFKGDSHTFLNFYDKTETKTSITIKPSVLQNFSGFQNEAKIQEYIKEWIEKKMEKQRDVPLNNEIEPQKKERTRIFEPQPKMGRSIPPRSL